MLETISPYGLYLVLAPAVTGLIVMLFGRRRILREGISLAGMVLTFMLSVMVFSMSKTTVLTSFDNLLRIDLLSGLFVGLIGFIGLVCLIYSFGFFKRFKENKTVDDKKIQGFYWQMLFLISAMFLVVISNNIIMMWVVIELTTVISALLVAFYWRKESLEAAFKFVVLISVGITFALLGSVMLYAKAASVAVAGQNPLHMNVIAEIIGKGLIPAQVLVPIFAFLLIGYGTKAGIVPFHTWLPDSYSEAPMPATALLSGALTKIGIYALIRTLVPFFGVDPHFGMFVALIGVLTMVVGVSMMFIQEDLKRFLAYSSISQIGYIVMGLGLAGCTAYYCIGTNCVLTDGPYYGAYGMLFHIINHAIVKVLLFFCVGAIIYQTGIRKIKELGGLGKKMPITAGCFIIAGFSISGVPILNGFVSKFLLFTSGVKTPGMIWTTIIAVAASALTLTAFIYVSYKVFMGKETEAVKKIKREELPANMLVVMIALTTICFAIGIRYQFVNEPIKAAANFVLTLTTGK